MAAVRGRWEPVDPAGRGEPGASGRAVHGRSTRVRATRARHTSPAARARRDRGVEGRSSGHVPGTFPLVLASNPCRAATTQTAPVVLVHPDAVRRYAQRISGPVRDRITCESWSRHPRSPAWRRGWGRRSRQGGRRARRRGARPPAPPARRNPVAAQRRRSRPGAPARPSTTGNRSGRCTRHCGRDYSPPAAPTGCCGSLGRWPTWPVATGPAWPTPRRGGGSPPRTEQHERAERMAERVARTSSVRTGGEPWHQSAIKAAVRRGANKSRRPGRAALKVIAASIRRHGIERRAPRPSTAPTCFAGPTRRGRGSCVLVIRSGPPVWKRSTSPRTPGSGRPAAARSVCGGTRRARTHGRGHRPVGCRGRLAGGHRIRCARRRRSAADLATAVDGGVGAPTASTRPRIGAPSRWAESPWPCWACGVDVVTERPCGLLHRVGGEGLIVSELAPGSTPTRSRFLARNRLIAAMTGGTVVVEAALRSGR